MTLFIYKYLIDSEWFTKNVKEWTWLSEKEGKSDLIATSKAEGEGIWE